RRVVADGPVGIDAERDAVVPRGGQRVLPRQQVDAERGGGVVGHAVQGQAGHAQGAGVQRDGVAFLGGVVADGAVEPLVADRFSPLVFYGIPNDGPILAVQDEPVHVNAVVHIAVEGLDVTGGQPEATTRPARTDVVVADGAVDRVGA